MVFRAAVGFACLALGGAIAARAVSAAELLPVREEFRVNPVAAGSQSYPRLAGHPGGFIVVWREANQVFGRRYDGEGMALDTQIPLLPSVPTIHAGLSLSARPSGDFAIAWSDGSAMRVQRFAADGTALGSPLQANATPVGLDCAIAAYAGGFFVVWRAASSDDLMGRRYDASGVPITGEFTVASSVVATPHVAVDAAGNGVVAWATKNIAGGVGGVAARRYDAAGAPLGAQFDVSNSTRDGPRVAMDAAGAFVVVWTTVPDVVARRYGSDGLPLGAEFTVSTHGAGFQLFPLAVTIDGAAGLVVVWSRTEGTSSFDHRDVFLRRFDGGTPQGPNVRVNTHRAKDQDVPDVATDGAGHVLAVWQSIDQDGLGASVYAQRYGFESPIAGASLAMRDDADPTRRRVVFRSNDRSISTDPGAGVDPTVNGAVLRVYNANGSGEVACIDLPAAGWTTSGNPEHPVDRYADAAGLYGPCKTAVVSHRRMLKAVCRATVQPIPYSLDEPQQASVGVDLLVHGNRYCNVFGGVIAQDSGTDKRFTARKAPPLLSCSAAPVCP